MAKQKTKFNIMDALILLAVLAIIALLLYVFVFSENSALKNAGADTYTLTYVVEVTEISDEFSDLISAGDRVIDSAKKMHIGTVTAVEVQPYLYMGTDTHAGNLVLNPVDGYVNMYITIQADAVLNGATYSIDGYDIYIGEKMHLAFPDMVCTGHCIALDAVQ